MNTEQYQPMNTIPTIPTEEGGYDMILIPEKWLVSKL